MPKTAILLQKLKTKTADALKQIATKCGINTGGTKPILLQRIAQELQTPLLRPLPTSTPHRILSIDMGIRNLALCSLSIPPNQVPQITSWSRVTVSPKTSSTPETFEPIDYAAKAYSLMKDSLDTYKPHTILIERQRYRSGGGVAVQEWTVRVNMLESMFHAVLHTLSQAQPPPSLDVPGFVVHSVSPKKITHLWVQEEGRMTARETKAKKIAVAKEIVEGEEADMRLEFCGQAREVAEKFHIRGEGKADDLADSMLQGLGWWRWHINREKMVEEILAWEDDVKQPRDKETAGKEKQRGNKTRRRKSKKAEVEIENSGTSYIIAEDLASIIESETAGPVEKVFSPLPPQKAKASKRSKKMVLEMHV